MDLSLLTDPLIDFYPIPCQSCGKRIDLLHHKFVKHMTDGGTEEEFFIKHEINRLCCRMHIPRQHFVNRGSDYYNLDLIQGKRNLDTGPNSGPVPGITGSVMRVGNIDGKNMYSIGGAGRMGMMRDVPIGMDKSSTPLGGPTYIPQEPVAVPPGYKRVEPKSEQASMQIEPVQIAGLTSLSQMNKLNAQFGQMNIQPGQTGSLTSGFSASSLLSKVPPPVSPFQSSFPPSSSPFPPSFPPSSSPFPPSSSPFPPSVPGFQSFPPSSSPFPHSFPPSSSPFPPSVPGFQSFSPSVPGFQSFPPSVSAMSLLQQRPSSIGQGLMSQIQLPTTPIRPARPTNIADLRRTAELASVGTTAIITATLKERTLGYTITPEERKTMSISSAGALVGREKRKPMKPGQLMDEYVTFYHLPDESETLMSYTSREPPQTGQLLDKYGTRYIPGDQFEVMLPYYMDVGYYPPNIQDAISMSRPEHLLPKKEDIFNITTVDPNNSHEVLKSVTTKLYPRASARVGPPVLRGDHVTQYMFAT